MKKLVQYDRVDMEYHINAKIFYNHDTVITTIVYKEFWKTQFENQALKYNLYIIVNGEKEYITHKNIINAITLNRKGEK